MAQQQHISQTLSWTYICVIVSPHCAGVCSVFSSCALTFPLFLPAPSVLHPLVHSPRIVQIQIHTQCCFPLPVLFLLSLSLPLSLSFFIPPFMSHFNARSSKSNCTHVWCSLLWRCGQTRIRSPSVWGQWKCCEISPSTGNKASSTMPTQCTSSRTFPLILFYVLIKNVHKTTLGCFPLCLLPSNIVWS